VGLTLRVPHAEYSRIFRCHTGFLRCVRGPYNSGHAVDTQWSHGGVDSRFGVVLLEARDALEIHARRCPSPTVPDAVYELVMGPPGDTQPA